LVAVGVTKAEEVTVMGALVKYLLSFRWYLPLPRLIPVTGGISDPIKSESAVSRRAIVSIQSNKWFWSVQVAAALGVSLPGRCDNWVQNR
jgi:hypothetical protein